MFRGLNRWAGRKRTLRLERLLQALAEEPEAYKDADALAKVTGIGSAVYPLLAALSRQGRAENCWLETPQGPRLAYRLAAEDGHEDLGKTRIRAEN